MNGVHDMGGMHGLGAIPYEPNEPVFHAGWEARVSGLPRTVERGGGGAPMRSASRSSRSPARTICG